MKAIIPIGGRGTRMRPVTFTANKHFIPVANKPLIHYPIESVANAGVKQVAITYNPGQLEFAKDFLGDGSQWGIEITYVLQPKPIGLANIVEVCKDWVGDDLFFLHLGDNIFVDGITQLVEYFQDKKPDGLVAMIRHPENSRMGVPYFNDKGQLTKYVEKPTNPPHDYAVPGLYFGNSNFFKAFKGKDKIKPSDRGEYEIPSVFQWLIDHKYQVDVQEYAGKWLDPGKFNDWLETNQYLLDLQVKNEHQSPVTDTKLEGRVDIGKNCQIKNSTIRGPVRIGDDVIIENSFIGPYTSIYHHSRIVNCHLENSVLMESVHLTDITQPIDTSIIGPFSEIARKPKTPNLELFVGEMSKITL